MTFVCVPFSFARTAGHVWIEVKLINCGCLWMRLTQETSGSGSDWRWHVKIVCACVSAQLPQKSCPHHKRCDKQRIPPNETHIHVIQTDLSTISIGFSASTLCSTLFGVRIARLYTWLPCIVVSSRPYENTTVFSLLSALQRTCMNYKWSTMRRRGRQ